MQSRCARLLTVAGLEVTLALRLLEQLSRYAVVTRYELERTELIEYPESDKAVTIALHWVMAMVSPLSSSDVL
jgi:hypothetical protein